jgi:enoyl-CoA hydratase/carnithine racemase
MTAVDAVLADWLEEFDRFAAARKPTIAAVRGHAVGGGFELALSCDIMVCAEDANLALPETGIGVIAGQGGTQRLIQLAGRAIASDLILTGRALSGLEAAALGIAARTCPAADVLAQAVAIGRRIGERSAPAVRFAREVIREAAEHPMRQSLRMERLLAALILDTPERKQRVAAFLNRKAPGS